MQGLTHDIVTTDKFARLLEQVYGLKPTIEGGNSFILPLPLTQLKWDSEKLAKFNELFCWAVQHKDITEYSIGGRGQRSELVGKWAQLRRETQAAQQGQNTNTQKSAEPSKVSMEKIL